MSSVTVYGRHSPIYAKDPKPGIITGLGFLHL